jgi:hypothetical protein
MSITTRKLLHLSVEEVCIDEIGTRTRPKTFAGVHHRVRFFQDSLKESLRFWEAIRLKKTSPGKRELVPGVS